MIERFDAIISLVGGEISLHGEKVFYRSGQTPPSDSEIDAEIIRLQAEYDSLAYSRARATAYDSVGNQLDMLMKDMRDGTTTHQTACEAVKTRFPKP